MQGISVRWVQRKRRLAADLGVQVPPRAKMPEAGFIELGGRGDSSAFQCGVVTQPVSDSFFIRKVWHEGFASIPIPIDTRTRHVSLPRPVTGRASHARRYLFPVRRYLFPVKGPRSGLRGAGAMLLYDAFVSYSHAKDKPIAAALQSVIQRLGKPWYRRRALRVFRDDSSLSATPSLWPSIERALLQSRFLILLASPEAAASLWVTKEICWWLDHKSADTLLIALTRGELSWDNTLGDFIWRDGMPLPPALSGRFLSEPRWVDLRAYRDGANPRDARFIEAGADFAAAIIGMPKEDLLSQEVRQQRRALILAWSAAGSLMILAVLAGWQWKIAIEQRNAAELQRTLAQEQRSRAERTLEAATKTSNSLVIDLARQFRNRAGMPLDLVRTILDRAQGLQRQLADAGEKSPTLRSSEATALLDVTDTLWSLGDVKSAVAAAERGCAIMEELVAVEPADLRWQAELSASYIKFGDVLIAAGRREDSLAQYRKALPVIEKLVNGDPKSLSFRNKLASVYLRFGNAFMNGGKPEAALAEFQRSLKIFRRTCCNQSG
jgi:tetratricopeptide (TPR) repeat protein